MTVGFFTEGIDFHLNRPIKYRNWLLALAASEATGIESLTYIFCSDEVLLAMNQKYLNHDTLTDIITFPYHESNFAIIGDVFISIERVRENAEKFKEPFEVELRRIMAHGLLHLIGYNDKTEEETKVMRKKEAEALQLFR